MKINRLFVSGYKNLFNCEVRPTGLHAITGPNGSGKTNLLEAVQIVAFFLQASEKDRERLLTEGETGFSLFSWIPVFELKEANPFKFSIDVLLKVGDKQWQLVYEFGFMPISWNESFRHAREHDSKEKFGVSHERLLAKEVGTPGKLKTIISRDESGKTIYRKLNSVSRIQQTINCRRNMLALHALHVIDGKFEESEPVISAFRQSLIALRFLRIDAISSYQTAFETLADQKQKSDASLGFTSTLNLHREIEKIRENPNRWAEALFWLERLCGITDIKDVTPNSDDISSSKYRVLIFLRGEKPFVSPMLSTGNMYLVAVIIQIFSDLESRESCLFIDEPEIYLHPAALIDLMRLLRSVSKDRSVIFSTHSPIALNSMRPEEVSLMVHINENCVTVRPVSEIKEAMKALTKGRVNFGDLLQLNYDLEDRD